MTTLRPSYERYNDRLSDLFHAVQEWGDSKGYGRPPAAQDEGWLRLTLGDIDIEFTFKQEDRHHGNPVWVEDTSTGGYQVTFGDLPRKEALLGLLDGILRGQDAMS